MKETTKVAQDQDTLLAAALIGTMRSLPEDRRKSIMGQIESEYCRHCGRETGFYCYCMNDE